jgi:hypothetical protein
VVVRDARAGHTVSLRRWLGGEALFGDRGHGRKLHRRPGSLRPVNEDGTVIRIGPFSEWPAIHPKAPLPESQNDVLLGYFRTASFTPSSLRWSSARNQGRQVPRFPREAVCDARSLAH